jgi:hypothetical protein
MLKLTALEIGRTENVAVEAPPTRSELAAC